MALKMICLQMRKLYSFCLLLAHSGIELSTEGFGVLEPCARAVACARPSFRSDTCSGASLLTGAESPQRQTRHPQGERKEQPLVAWSPLCRTCYTIGNKECCNRETHQRHLSRPAPSLQLAC